MAYNAQKYRYGGTVVEVYKIKTISEYKSKFQCLVRGYGHNNPAPRETFVMDTETPAIASRKAVQMYINKYGKEK